MSADVQRSLKSRIMAVPIFTASVNRFAGSLIMPGVTAGTDLGVGIVNTATSNARVIGALAQLHSDSVSGAALVDGTVDWYPADGQLATGKTQFPANDVELLDTATIVKCDYDLTSTMAASSGTTTTVVVTSLEASLGAVFVYFPGGTGIGQLAYSSSQSGTTLTFPTALTTAPDGTTTIVKLLRLFHELVVWVVPTATAGTKLGTTAAAGTGRAAVLNRRFIRNGRDVDLNPLSHHNLQGLNSLAQLQFYSLLALQNTIYHPNS